MRKKDFIEKYKNQQADGFGYYTFDVSDQLEEDLVAVLHREENMDITFVDSLFSQRYFMTECHHLIQLNVEQMKMLTAMVMQMVDRDVTLVEIGDLYNYIPDQMDASILPLRDDDLVQRLTEEQKEDADAFRKRQLWG